MTLDVLIADKLSTKTVADLEAMGAELGFTVRLQHENIFVATNQLRMAHGRSGPSVSHSADH